MLHLLLLVTALAAGQPAPARTPEAIRKDIADTYRRLDQLERELMAATGTKPVAVYSAEEANSLKVGQVVTFGGVGNQPDVVVREVANKTTLVVEILFSRSGNPRFVIRKHPTAGLVDGSLIDRPMARWRVVGTEKQLGRTMFVIEPCVPHPDASKK